MIGIRRAGELGIAAIHVVVADAGDGIEIGRLLVELDVDAEELRPPGGLLPGREIRDVHEGACRVVRQRVEANAVRVVELVEHQGGHRLHRLDTRPVIREPVGIVLHFLVERAGDRLGGAGRIRPRVGVARRRALGDIEVDALEGRRGVVVRARGRAELVEARMDMGGILVALARPAVAGRTVAQPLVRRIGGDDGLVAPFDAGLPVVMGDVRKARCRHAGICRVAASEDRRRRLAGLVPRRSSVVEGVGHAGDRETLEPHQRGRHGEPHPLARRGQCAHVAP